MRFKGTRHFVHAAVSAAAFVSGADIAQAVTTINLAVASDFYGSSGGFPTSSPIGHIISSFVAANPSYSVQVIQTGPSLQLENQITSSNNALNIDLLLSGDSNVPFDLYNNYPTMIEGIPFDYAVGTLAFWSNNPAYNVSGGFNPTTDYDSVGYVDPQQSPYGEATLELLENRFGLTTFPQTWTSFTSIDAVFAAVRQNVVNVGFVAQSAICTNGYNGAYPTLGKSERVYPSGEFSKYYVTNTSGQGQFQANYSQIRYSAIRVNRSSTGGGSFPTYRDAGTENALSVFLNFLTSDYGYYRLAGYCFSPP